MSDSCIAFVLGMPGPFEMAIIGGIALLLFGNRLPKMMRGLGESVMELRRGAKSISEPLKEIEEDLKHE